MLLILGGILHCAAFCSSATPLSDRLDAILDRPAMRGAVVSVCVTKEDGSILYERNADLRAMPASNQKLLSVAFALHVLGPNWRPETRFWREPDRIVVDAPGDPSLTFEALLKVRDTLKAPPGLPVYVRQGYRPGVPPTWENDDLPHRYAPRITALTLNRASFTLVNDLGTPKLEPASFGVRILHFGGTSVRAEFDPFGNILVVRGDLPRERRTLENFAIPEPDRAAASVLGGRLFETLTVPERAPDYQLRGQSVAEMAKACLVPSDNYLAECLMLLAAAQDRPLGENPYATAPNRLRDFLVNTVGLSRDEVRPADGSGMSRHNLVTARGIAKQLAWTLQQPTAPLWLGALAKPGSGTLTGRLNGSSFVGKTGSLNMVIGLSGFVKAASGERKIVSILLNQFLCTASEARSIADDFVRELEKPASFAPNPVTPWRSS